MPAGPASPELAGVLAGLGINGGDFTQAEADPDDLPVRVRRRSVGREVGDTDTTTESEAIKELYAMDEAGVRKLQERLVRAGVLDPEDFSPGQADPATVNAYTKMVGRAALTLDAGRDTTVEEIIDQTIAAGGVKKQAAKRALVNPTDVVELARRVGPDVIGRRPSEAAAQKYAAMYQAMQAAAEESDVAPPTLQSFLSSQLRTDNPGLAQRTDTLEQGNEFFDLLREVNQFRA